MYQSSEQKGFEVAVKEAARREVEKAFGSLFLLQLVALGT